jgi:heme/copper-type cytochrome/quinol oxidase subunit 2
MLGLLALTGFHGLTMMPFWEQWTQHLAQLIGDSGQLLTSFSLLLFAFLVIISGLYAFFIALTQKISPHNITYKAVFSNFAFVTLPLAFAYHMAHNLNNLIRESAGIGAVLSNPLGINTLPLSMMEKHQRHLILPISQDVIFALQAGLIIFGFWIAIQVIRARGNKITQIKTKSTYPLIPILLFTIGLTLFHLWLLMQPMTMRM